MTQESFYLPSRTTSKNKVLIWTYKEDHESAQRFNKTFKKHSYYTFVAQMRSSIWGGKRRKIIGKKNDFLTIQYPSTGNLQKRQKNRGRKKAESTTTGNK